MDSDLKIAQSRKLRHISEIAKSVNVPESDLELYGKYKAKLPLKLIDDKKVKSAKLILVTAMTPTPAGEGKTTTSIALTEGLNKIGKRTTVVLREPSLGPVFGMKGGAAGGGYAQVVPMEDINLHFTGDFAAIEKANNLLASLIDNNIQSKTPNLNLDSRTVEWKRVMDMNDRALRNIVSGMGGKSGGFMRETGFNITAASEIMAILCLARDIEDLKEKMGNIYIGDTLGGEAVFARDLNAQGAMAVLLKDAIKPNLVQTLEGNPAIIHGGPFANIAQGTNSLIATKMGMTLTDYVVTEAGFGADLGAEKFLNIKCQYGDIHPHAVVLVATIRALKYHGGQARAELTESNTVALVKGLANLEKHIENMKTFGMPVIVSLNRFISDTEEEIRIVTEWCAKQKIRISVCEGWEKGGKGAVDLAEQVAEEADSFKGSFKPIYNWDWSVKEKIEAIARKVYGAKDIEYLPKAKQNIHKLERIGLSNRPVCIAKTQNSFSDDPRALGRPQNFTVTVREIEIAAGAGYSIPIMGNMLRMPGLPSVPAATSMDIDNEGIITGLS
jgi:formate--tetrahydrofolate ligase